MSRTCSAARRLAFSHWPLPSVCSGACAQAWPPATNTGTPKASGAVKASLLGTTKRADGSSEVTYAGHPLYTFAGDTQPGQTTGQGSNGFGAPWWVVTPAGTLETRRLPGSGAGPSPDRLSPLVPHPSS